jgi:putative transposase
LKPYLDTYAYCLMGNHFHFVVYVKAVDESILKSIENEHTEMANRFLNNEVDYDAFLTDQFRRFFSAYAHMYNTQQKRHGSLFQEKFKHVQLKSIIAVLDKICYVHHNPIHHGYHSVYENWKYSSYDVYLDDRICSLEREKGLALFGSNLDNRKPFIEHHQIYKANWRFWNNLEDDM